MRLILTGGGTGGHIYPALEVGRHCAEQGAELHYLGSLRGQEGGICQKRGIPFQGFPSQPLYSIKTPRGWIAAANLLRASLQAKSALKRIKPDAVFSTGGYSAAPVMHAARSLGIPYVIHEQNSVPGRSNLMFAQKAHKVAVTFNRSLNEFPGAQVVRTGMPVRLELRQAASGHQSSIINHQSSPPHVLVIGGSQGSIVLNEMMPLVSNHVRTEGVTFMHSAGPKNYEKVRFAVEHMPAHDYEVAAFLEADALIHEYQTAGVAVARSGGTLAEFAVFGLPSVLIPLPSAAGNHQFHNAMEFRDMGAATIQEEGKLTVGSLADSISDWLESRSKREAAAEALRKWDVPDATEQLGALIWEAAGK